MILSVAADFSATMHSTGLAMTEESGVDILNGDVRTY